jgi:hypothetical protein
VFFNCCSDGGHTPHQTLQTSGRRRRLKVVLLRELAPEARVLGRSGGAGGAGVELVSRLSMSGRWKGCLLGEAVQIGESMCIVCWVEHREDFTSWMSVIVCEEW